MADVAQIRKRVQRAIEQARREAADRRSRVHEAQKACEEYLETRAIPAFRSVAVVLKSEGLAWEVMTPSGVVRLVPDRRRDDSIRAGVRRHRGSASTDGQHHPGPRRPCRPHRAARQGGHALSAALSDDEVLEMLVEELRPWLA